MGALGGLLGLNGGINGTGIAGPQGTQINPGVNPDQIAASYGGTQNSLQSQQALLAALQAQGGLQNQSQVYGQLQNVAAGTGPNPAQNMLNQATGQNVANQGALMAGQRGAGANVGLLASQAARQGANIQQQAVGQGATMQSQQQLGALGAAGNMANQQAGQQIGATGANTQANLQQQQLLQQANAQANQANVGMQGNINAANAGLAGDSIKAQQGLIGGVISAAGTAAAAGAADGGVVVSGSAPGPQSYFGQFMATGMAKGGKVPVVVSPGERYLPPQAAKDVASGKKSASKVGEKIPGKAKVSGDSEKNDTVPRMLEPGGVVVKRSVENAKDHETKAADFVRAVLAKKGRK